MDEIEKRDIYIKTLEDFIEKIYIDLSQLKKYMDDELHPENVEIVNKLIKEE